MRFTNRTADVTLEGRLGRMGSDIVSRRGYEGSKSWLDWARAPIATGPYKVREFIPDQSLVMDAHDDYWGGKPPLKSVKLVVVPEVATRINGLLAGQFDFICDVPPDQIPGIEKNAKFEVLGSTIVNHRLTVFDNHHPTLVDPRVRQAFTHAITVRPSSTRCGRAARACRPACSGSSTVRCSSRTGRCRNTTSPRPRHS